MRLIDADKLVEICRKGWKLFGREDEKLKHWIDEDDIRNQPTAKAIPIEWMKNYARKICTDGRYNSKAYGIDRMIYDWEKENERKEE